MLIAVMIITGCATKVVSIYNTDIKRQTPNTYLLQTSENLGSLSVDNKKLDSILQGIIISGLDNKGLKSSSLPDLYVSYLINVYSSSETTSNYDLYSYSYYSYYNYTTRNYKEGVLIIDIKNDDGILVWQGSKTFRLRSRLSVHDLLPKICREIIETYKL